MRRTKLVLMGVLIALASSASMAGGGCLAGTYSYYNDDGELVGAATVGCNPNTGWGQQTDNAVFHPGCYASS
jgi:hypothetical protein